MDITLNGQTNSRIEDTFGLPEFIKGLEGNIEYDFIKGNAIDDASENTTSFVLGRESIAFRKGLIAIVCHPHPVHGGTKDNKVVHTLCRSWRDQGIDCLRFNFRGVGFKETQYS